MIGFGYTILIWGFCFIGGFDEEDELSLEEDSLKEETFLTGFYSIHFLLIPHNFESGFSSMLTTESSFNKSHVN